MIQLVKNILKKTPLYDYYRAASTASRQKKELSEWLKSGRGVPVPHLVKQQTIKKYAQDYNIGILVETGTFFGDMIAAMLDSFEKIYSIELSEDLHARAKRRFRSSKKVELICGDSGKEIRRVIAKLDKPAIFWLDGHYSGGITAKGEKDTPVIEEIEHILEAPEKGHVVIIDDARCFGEDPVYPTVKELEEMVRNKRDDLELTVADDSIRIVPTRN